MSVLKTMYVSRGLVNARDLRTWATEQGFKSTIPPDDMHVTVAYSRQPVDWFAFDTGWAPDKLEVPAGGPRSVEPLGDKGAIVLKFKSSDLSWRWQDFMDGGASWDYPEYQPHVTITYDGGGVDLSGIEPYTGPLLFGPEIFAEVDDSWKENTVEKFDSTQAVLKVDTAKRIVWGWFSVVKENGVDVVDHHGDVIKIDTLQSAAHNFVLDSRAGKLMHGGKRLADVVDSIVFTEDVQKALGIDLKKEGWFGGFKIRDETLWEKVQRGEFPAFSFGGYGERVPYNAD